MLTDKAKIEFESYYNNSTADFLLNGIDFDDLPLCVKNALIIDWFDSIGIYIVNNRSFRFNKWNYEILGNFTSGFDSKSRQEATKKAIEKANEIYNI